MSNFIRLVVPRGLKDQSANTILINATNTAIPANNSNSCFVTPIREASNNKALYYNVVTNEITYADPSGSGGGGGGTGTSLWALDSSMNFWGPSGNALDDNTGVRNTVGGYGAMHGSNSSSYNTAFGYKALNAHTGPGNWNVAIGYASTSLLMFQGGRIPPWEL